ncbi:flagellar biosynthesis protein FlhF [Methylobacillus arboreus]|uniref:flagellar biosynthesis protein FlhF n=1 Tax=Methylobacillus arboreus TaxID=755170 RepID=UPI001E604C42|nr:flagellar biosynthesis protein FlhF [Methylobacillus arboreus]MCB5189294.1 flagellar biosynthesis protein FlhF [Methylobacillus arboreus]
MNIKRYFGKNSREALNMVKQELGADAVILSNRAVEGGNEILAFREEDMANLVARNKPKPAIVQPAPAAPAAEETLVSMLSRNQRILKTAQPLNHQELQQQRSQATRQKTVLTAPQVAKPQVAKPLVQNAAKPVHEQVKQTNHTQREMAHMMQELRSMRGAIESQLTEMTWTNIQQRDPVKSSMLCKMIAAGFSAGLARQIAEKVPADRTEAEAMKWLHSVIGNNIHTISDEQQMLDQGGIYALIGPTGVGKTTTTAKLAARFVMKHGAGKLALITTDSYRIGGHEQLRIYGKILGVMVHAVKDEADLRIALNELKGKHTILIDTVGVSQRDRMVTEQIAMLSNTGLPIKKILCMNATSSGETLADVIDAYKRRGLDGCIITKLDEAASIGSTLDVIIRERLKVYYVANGQRVPEDIHLANNTFLAHHAFKMARKKSEQFQFRDAEMPFLMANIASNNKMSGDLA